MSGPPDAGCLNAAATLGLESMLHYLQDWSGTLAEFHRVLAPGGRLLVSVNHPLASAILEPEEDYFATRPQVDVYDFDGTAVELALWHRPLHAMSDAFEAAGFRIARMSEPRPAPDTPPGLLPPRIRIGERSAFIGFLLFVLERD